MELNTGIIIETRGSFECGNTIVLLVGTSFVYSLTIFSISRTKTLRDDGKNKARGRKPVSVV